MRKTLLMLLLGFASGALVVYIFGYRVDAKAKYNYGRYHGEIMTKMEILESIPKALGDDYQVADGYRALFKVKDCAVVVVERNGVKTLRVYKPGPPQEPEPDGAANRSQPVGAETNRTLPATGSGG